MISLIIFLFILGILIIVHEFGHFIIAKRTGVRVEKFSLGFGPIIFRFVFPTGKYRHRENETQYCISAIPLGGYVKLAGDNLLDYKGNKDEYLAQTPAKRSAIIFFGPLLNYVLGFLCFWLIFFVGYPTLTNRVGGLIDGFGAKEAGIQVGDKIIAVDDRKVASWEDLQNIIQDKRGGKVVNLSVSRDNKEHLIGVVIKEKILSDVLGQKRNVGLLGITPSNEFVKVRHGFLQSFLLGLNKTGELTFITAKALGNLVTGKLSMRESVTGPLGIFYITSKAAELGTIALLHLIAVLSVSLAIFNLLPLPVLDGGHILLLAIEKIRGRALSRKCERIITQIGLTVIVSLAIIVTYNDILRFFGDKISKFFK